MRTGRRAVLLGAPGLAGAARAQPAFALGAWLDAWEAVLRRHVDAEGRTHFTGLAATPDGLRAVVEGMVVDPGRLPASENLAYLVNGYNALAMWGIVQRGIPREFDLLGRYAFFVRTQFRVGERRMSLKSLEDDIIRPLGDERVHFVLNCMVRGCPRLPREAFRPERLEAQLAAAAIEFCESGYQVRPQPAARVVWLSQIFQFYEPDFTPARAPSLLAYVNRHRRSRLDPTWKTRHFDYDWTVNAQPAGGPQAG